MDKNGLIQMKDMNGLKHLKDKNGLILMRGGLKMKKEDVVYVIMVYIKNL